MSPEIFSSEHRKSAYTYRMSDARLGRFWSVDPLAGKYPWNSVYAFSENRVIDGVELEGLEVNLMNKEKDPMIFNGANSIKDKNAIHIIAHGSPSSFTDGVRGNDRITTVNQFENVVKRSELWKPNSRLNDFVYVLHSCRTGRPASMNKNRQKPIAQKLSAAIEGTVIAPDERVYFSDEKKIGPFRASGTDEFSDYKEGINPLVQTRLVNSPGNWMVYTNGVLTAVYSGELSSAVLYGGETDISKYKKELSFIVSSPTLNVRSGPGAKNEALGTIFKGNEVFPTGNSSKGWMEISGGGKTGWIHQDYVNPKY